MPSFRLSREALLDLDAIADYIMDDNPARAVSFVDELSDRFRLAAEQPKAYPSRDDLSPGLRSCAHGRYRIFFRIKGDGIEVVRVLQTARDIASLF